MVGDDVVFALAPLERDQRIMQRGHDAVIAPTERSSRGTNNAGDRIGWPK
jgi:hypothetical protein